MRSRGVRGVRERPRQRQLDAVFQRPHARALNHRDKPLPKVHLAEGVEGAAAAAVDVLEHFGVAVVRRHHERRQPAVVAHAVARWSGGGVGWVGEERSVAAQPEPSVVQALHQYPSPPTPLAPPPPQGYSPTCAVLHQEVVHVGLVVDDTHVERGVAAVFLGEAGGRGGERATVREPVCCSSPRLPSSIEHKPPTVGPACPSKAAHCMSRSPLTLAPWRLRCATTSFCPVHAANDSGYSPLEEGRGGGRGAGVVSTLTGMQSSPVQPLVSQQLRCWLCCVQARPRHAQPPPVCRPLTSTCGRRARRTCPTRAHGCRHPPAPGT
jgi:hypothetical protein